MVQRGELRGSALEDAKPPLSQRIRAVLAQACTRFDNLVPGWSVRGNPQSASLAGHVLEAHLILARAAGHVAGEHHRGETAGQMHASRDKVNAIRRVEQTRQCRIERITVGQCPPAHHDLAGAAGIAVAMERGEDRQSCITPVLHRGRCRGLRRHGQPGLGRRWTGRPHHSGQRSLGGGRAGRHGRVVRPRQRAAPVQHQPHRQCSLRQRAAPAAAARGSLARSGRSGAQEALTTGLVSLAGVGT